jgi:hypothetical protein
LKQTATGRTRPADVRRIRGVNAAASLKIWSLVAPGLHHHYHLGLPPLH